MKKAIMASIIALSAIGLVGCDLSPATWVSR